MKLPPETSKVEPLQKTQPSHVAFLVPSVRKAADYLHRFDFKIGKEEDSDEEGSREIYVEKEKANSLLLIEPFKAGAYQQALDKSGPGLHHLAIDVLNLETYIESLSGSGWLLHPLSIKMFKRSQTVSLARPRFPGLIEVQKRKRLSGGPLFIDNLSIKMDSSVHRLLKHVGLDLIVKPSSNTELSLEGRIIQLQELF